MKNYFIPTEENKHHVDDYPYGYSERCEMSYWFDINKNGVRMCRQSLYNGRFNTPKRSTYSLAGLAYLNEDGHLKWYSLSQYSTKEQQDLFFEKLATVENRPPYYQSLLDAHNGVLVEEKIPYTFGKVDNSFSPAFNVVKLTFDTSTVEKRRIYEAVCAFEDQSILENGGGFRVFLKSEEIGFFGAKQMENWRARYAAELDPFATVSEEVKLIGLYRPIKKELNTNVAPGTRTFDRKTEYKLKAPFGGSDLTLRFLSEPKRDFKHRYKFKQIGNARCDGWFFQYPVIDENGYLVSIKPNRGFIIEIEPGIFYHSRWNAKKFYNTEEETKAYVFLTEKDAAKFQADFSVNGTIKKFAYVPTV